MINETLNYGIARINDAGQTNLHFYLGQKCGRNKEVAVVRLPDWVYEHDSCL